LQNQLDTLLGLLYTLYMVDLDKDCCLETYAEAYRLGKADENERILKLLHSEVCNELDVTYCHCGSWNEAIQLIKEDQK